GFRLTTSSAGDPAGPYAIPNVFDDSDVMGTAVYFPIRIEIPTGAEPIESASFDDDWSDLQATWPNIRLIDFDVDQVPNQDNCSPWNIEGWGPYGAIGINPLANASNSPADSGDWSCSTTGTT